MVDLFGGVDHAGEEVVGQALAAGREEGGEIGERAARRERPPGLPGEAGELAEPVDDVGLQAGERGGGGENGRVAVHRVGDEVRHRGLKQAAPRDVGQVAGARRVVGGLDGAVEEEVQQLGQGHARLGQGLGQRCRQLHAAPGVAHRLAGERRDVGHDPLQRRLHQSAHRGRVQLQRMIPAVGRDVILGGVGGIGRPGEGFGHGGVSWGSWD